MLTREARVSGVLPDGGRSNGRWTTHSQEFRNQRVDRFTVGVHNSLDVGGAQRETWRNREPGPQRLRQLRRLSAVNRLVRSVDQRVAGAVAAGAAAARGLAAGSPLLPYLPFR